MPNGQLARIDESLVVSPTGYWARFDAHVLGHRNPNHLRQLSVRCLL
jgi:hypothetical protein